MRTGREISRVQSGIGEVSLWEDVQRCMCVWEGGGSNISNPWYLRGDGLNGKVLRHAVLIIKEIQVVSDPTYSCTFCLYSVKVLLLLFILLKYY